MLALCDQQDQQTANISDFVEVVTPAGISSIKVLDVSII